VEETLCPGNLVTLVREEVPLKWDESGIAYAVFCKGIQIGNVPSRKRVAEYWVKAKKKGQTEKMASREKWGKCTVAVRTQFGLDYDNLGTEQWTAHVHEIIYEKDGSTKNYQKFSDLCNDLGHRPDDWHIQQIGIVFEDMEEPQ